MDPIDQVAPHRRALAALQRVLKRFDDRGLIIGGIAVGVIGRHPDLDRSRIEYRVRQCSLALEMPELWEDIAPWLSSFRSKQGLTREL